jgi:dimethylhistidine N-methyltransferase
LAQILQHIAALAPRANRQKAGSKIMARGTAAATTSAHQATTPCLRDARADILRGLTARQKRISAKYFYDERGSKLFDRICGLEEYYITRTELDLMQRHLAEIATLVGPRAAVVELGAGSSTKVRLLLDHLHDPAAYVPVDISRDYLLAQAQELAADYPHVHIEPVVADFTRPFRLPELPLVPERNLFFFPGSTIGNFSRARAHELLTFMAAEAKHDGALLIGVDLRKDPAILHAAYNDEAGVTAEFNLNVLARLNRELDADFRLRDFEHCAIYDETQSRIQMRLVSTRRQTVNVADVRVTFDEGEHIVTEHSHKYSVGEFRGLARSAGLSTERTWIDERALFSIHYLRA